MSYSVTRSATASQTVAEHLAQKIAGDLWLLHFLYKIPTEQSVREHIDEAVKLILSGYLKSLDYGFKRNGVVIFQLRYEIHWDGSVSRDDECGEIRAGMNLENATFYSYLSYNYKFDALTSDQQTAFEKTLPFQRGGAPTPTLATGGTSSADRQYSKDGVGMSRTVFDAT